MLGASLLLALREIRRHLLRSILTVLGIVIGVASVITMVTVGNGVTASVQAADRVTRREHAHRHPQYRRPPGGERSAASLQAAGRRGDEGTGRRHRRGGRPGKFKRHRHRRRHQLADRGHRHLQRRHHDPGDDDHLRAKLQPRTRKRPAKRSASSARRCGRICSRNVDPIGRELRVGKIACPIIGQLKERGKGGGGNDQDDVVLMPLRTVQRQLLGTTDIQWVVVGVNPELRQ